MKEYADNLTDCPNCGYVEGTAPKEVYHLAPGTILQERFQIGTVVGFGGFGVVYRAWDLSLDKMVAIKEFYPVGLINRVPGDANVIIFQNRRRDFFSQRDRFLEEARNMAKFSKHPNIVNVYNFFEENNTAYIAMEFLEGITYKTYLKNKEDKIEIDEALDIIQAVLGALEELHKSHIIHRDVALDNIFICDDGRIKLMDFGAARFSKDDIETAHTIILKPGYAPPEQYQAKSKQGVFTDIYAVGAVLYRSLTGVMPEESTNRFAEDNLKEPKELNPDISDALNNAIMRAMALNHELRFQTDSEFMKALQTDNKKKIRTVNGELKHRKKRRFVRIVAAFLILALCGALGYQLYEAKKAQIELRPATISMWVCVPGTEDANTYEEVYQLALQEYIEKYPQITLEIEAINEDEYESRLQAVAGTRQMPDVYQVISDETIFGGKKISRVWEYLTMSDYIGIDSVKKVYSKKNVCPITYEMPVLYKNTSFEEFDEIVMEADFEENMSDGRYDVDQVEVEAFLRGETPYLFADTSYYQEVQEHLAGIYQMSVPDYGSVAPAGYALRFAISKKANMEEHNAAIQLLYYLLSENAQTTLCISNHLGIPMHNNIYEQFVMLNTEYDIFNSEKDELVFQR